MSGFDLDFTAGAGLLLDAGLKATVVLLGALAATRLMRRRSAAARHLVWVVALAAVLALPALGRLLPAWKALPLPAFLRPVPAAQSAAPPVDPAAAQAVSRVAPEPAPASAPAAVSQASAPSTAAPPARAAVPSAPAAAAARPPLPFDWRAALLALWAAGGALLMVRLAYGLLRVRWIERRATEITDEGWVHITDSLARRLRVGRMVTLLREAHASVPMTWGVLRPVVLLPQEAEAWDRERRTVVLAHELAHIRRWDPLTQWIAHLALAVFWFHPLVWVAARKMREERERACDDAVLTLGTRPVSYADHLLDIVRSLGSAEGPAAALAMARRSQFEGRLLAILDQATPRGGVSRGLGVAALVVAAVGVVPLAALRAAEPRPLERAEPVSATARIERPAAMAAQPRETEKREPAGLLARLGGRIGEVLEGRSDPPAPETSQAEASAPLPAAAAVPLDERKVETVAREQSVTSADARALIRAVQEDTGTYRMVIRAAGGITSSAERASVLLAVLRQGDIGRADMVSLLRVAGGITTEAARRDVLKAAARSGLLADGEVRRAFFAAVAGMTTAAERRDVLVSVVRGGTSGVLLPDVVQAARAMTSDGERREVLVAVAECPCAGYEAFMAVVAAAREMSSPGERREVLKAVALRPNAGPEVLRAVVGATREIPSAAEQRDVLKAVLARPAATEPVVLAVLEAARHLTSAAEQRDVFKAVLARPAVGDNVLVAVLEGVRHITSAAEQRDVMRAVAARRPLSPRVREAYLSAAGSISSGSERADVLTALLGEREGRTAAAQSGGRAVQVEGTVLEHLWNSNISLTLDGGRTVRIVAKDVEFARNRWDLTGIRPGGSLVVEERVRGRSKRLEITPGPGGELRRSFRVDGQARPFKAEGENWMIAIIREFTGS